MTTVKENERLAVVETLLGETRSDVADIKKDHGAKLDILLASRHQQIGVGTFFMRALPFVALGMSIWAVAAR